MRPMFQAFVILFVVYAVGYLSWDPAAHASFNSPAAVDRSVTVTGTSAQILPADSARAYLLIENVCAQNVGISISPTTAVIGTANTITLYPGGSMEFSGSSVPQNAFNGISASGSCGLTIWEVK